MFVQYTCAHDEEDLLLRKQQALYAILINILICLLFLVFLFYFKRISNIFFEEWDMATTTIDDFTVKLPIEGRTFEKFWEEWKGDPDQSMVY